MNADSFPRGIEVVTGVVIENDLHQILLTESPKWPGKWVMPGGHVEPGETLLEAGVREGEEETGLKLNGIKIFYYGQLIGSRDFHRPAHILFFNAHCKVIGGTLRLDERELSSYKWVSPDEALALDLGESYDGTLKAYISYLSAVSCQTPNLKDKSDKIEL